MLRNRFCFIAIHVLLSVYTAQSFVILTANVDDIRNLARKFVSETLANKIADFVVRATSFISPTNMSNENESNEVNNNMSEENSYYKNRNNAQGEERDTEITTKEAKTVSIKKRDKKLHPRPWENVENSISDDSLEKYSKEAKTKKKYLRQPYHQDKQKPIARDRNFDQKPNPMSIEFQVQKMKQANTVSTKRDWVDTTSPSRNRWQLDDMPPPSPGKRKPKQRPMKLVAASEETKDAKIINWESPATKDQITLRGFNIESTLSTAKARNEFDQYDYAKYQKSNYVATSGPVSLPKVSTEKQWWERELRSASDKQMWF